jgi:hypothetical protein
MDTIIYGFVCNHLNATLHNKYKFILLSNLN